MGLLIHSKKRSLFHHDFQVPFYWTSSHHDFQVCAPLSPFYWTQFPSSFPGLCPFVSLLLGPSSHHDFQVCVPLSPLFWIQFHHDFEACPALSPFDSMQFRWFHHGLQCCLPRPVLPVFSRRISWHGSVSPWFGCFSLFASLVICQWRDPVPWWFTNLFSFVFPLSNFLVQESSSVMIWRFVSLCLHSNFLVQGFSFARFVSFCLSSSPVSSPFYFLELERKAVWGRCWCNYRFLVPSIFLPTSSA